MELIFPGGLAKMAHATFNSIQEQMKTLAIQIAKKYNLPSGDYRSVMKFLKKDQILGDSIMIVYKPHLTDIENIIGLKSWLVCQTGPP